MSLAQDAALDLIALEKLDLLEFQASSSYLAIKARIEAQIVRLEYANAPVHSYEPGHFETHLRKPGELVAADSSNAQVQYGYDSSGRVVVVVEKTSIPKLVYETFYLHELDGIAQFHFDYSKEKKWINLAWFSVGAGQVTRIDWRYQQLAHAQTLFQYHASGQLSQSRQIHDNHPYPMIDAVRRYEYNDRNQISVIWRSNFGSDKAVIEFERPRPENTLAAREKQLLEQISAEICADIQRRDMIDTVYAIILCHYGASYLDRLPPSFQIGLCTERTGFSEKFADAAVDYIWNPAEWASWTKPTYSTALLELCRQVNHDIWQNDREQAFLSFLVKLTQVLSRATLPIKASDDFAVLHIALDEGNYNDQVLRQIAPDLKAKLIGNGFLT
jgi:hypothetical protein